jgi:hypothetical protein
MLGSSPAHPHARQGSPNGLPTYPLFCYALLEADFGGLLHRPQAAFPTELPGAPVEHPAQSLGPFGIEGPMNAVCGGRLEPLRKRLGKALLVENLWMALRTV